uniref:Uncharacterized protein n=1 Tax=Strigamia maritima TaxID=126957 RepID=T1JI60_STRMM
MDLEMHYTTCSRPCEYSAVCCVCDADAEINLIVEVMIAKERLEFRGSGRRSQIQIHFRCNLNLDPSTTAPSGHCVDDEVNEVVELMLIDDG